MAEIEDSQLGTTRYAYDALGALTRAAYADGEQERRQPDAMGNLFRTLDRSDRQYRKGGQLQQAGGTQYRYDKLGNLVHKHTTGGQH